MQNTVIRFAGVMFVPLVLFVVVCFSRHCSPCESHSRLYLGKKKACSSLMKRLLHARFRWRAVTDGLEEEPRQTGSTRNSSGSKRHNGGALLRSAAGFEFQIELCFFGNVWSRRTGPHIHG